MVRLEFDANTSPRRTQPTLEHKRDMFFFCRMLEAPPKPMSNVCEPLEPCEAPSKKEEEVFQTSVLASRITVLSEMINSGADGLKRPAVRELQHLAEHVPPAAVISAGGDAALCGILCRAAETLRHQPGELSPNAAANQCQQLRQAFTALSAIARGERSSPPAWTTHATMLPAIRAALDALAATELNCVLFGSAASAARVAALREGAALFDTLYRQMLMDQTDTEHVASLGYSLPLPPSGSRLGWVDGAGLANRLPVLIDRGVPLLPRGPPSQVAMQHDATTAVLPSGSLAHARGLPLSPRRHVLPRRRLPAVRRPTNIPHAD